MAATLLSGSVAEANPKTFTVTNTANTGAGSLRQAILDADTYGDANPSVLDTEVVFQSGLSGSIDLASALPEITHPLDIVGPGADKLTVNGGGANRIFHFNAPVPVGYVNAISGLTLTDGNAGIASGGAVYAYGATTALSLSDVTVSNSSAMYGGGISTQAYLVIGDSTVSGNTATAAGGGVASSSGLAIFDSTISGNTADSELGGGIDDFGGSVYIGESTVADNHATGTGGGIYLGPKTPGPTTSTVTLLSTIVSGNTSTGGGPDVFTGPGVPAPHATFSLFGSLSGSAITPDSTDLVGVDPKLAPLAAAGGPTPTMVPADNSPVIDRGDNPAGLGFTQDQRGLPRTVDLPGYPNAIGGDGTDIGAVELQPAEVLPTVGGLSAALGTAGSSVVITGTHLAAATKVLFGTTSASFAVNSDTQLTATVPPGTGTVDIRVISPGGESAIVPADRFQTVLPKPPPPVRVMATFFNQQLELTTPSLQTCTSVTATLPVTFSSTAIPHSKAEHLQFGNAAFYLGKGVKHTHKRTITLKSGKHKQITVTSYSANAVTHHANGTVALKLSGQKGGSQTLKVIVTYTKTTTRHHHKHTVIVTKAMTTTVRIC